MRTSVVVLVVLIVLVVGTLVYLVSQNTKPVVITGNQPSNQQGQTYNVAISNFAFSPGVTSIHKGDTVIWTNQDSASHTVTSDSGSELASQTLSTGSIYSHTFNNAGTFSYHCSIHPSMTGQVIVQ